MAHEKYVLRMWVSGPHKRLKAIHDFGFVVYPEIKLVDVRVEDVDKRGGSKVAVIAAADYPDTEKFESSMKEYLYRRAPSPLNPFLAADEDGSGEAVWTQMPGKFSEDDEFAIQKQYLFDQA